MAAGSDAVGETMTATSVLRPALVEALIGAVLDELGAVGVARTTPAATKTAPRRRISTVSAEG